MVGVLSVYESRLQTSYGWKRPFDEVETLLRGKGYAAEADWFDDYRLAVNVLKHGAGSSHNKLLSRANRLQFRVQSVVGNLHEEGDVCPPSDLIVVSVKNLEQCCDVIEKSWEVILASNPISLKVA